MSALPPIATSIAFLGMSALRQKRKGDLRTAVRYADDHHNVGSPDDHAGPKTSNNIIQNGLAFARKQSASVTGSGR
jgi:hypothetical protein